MNPIEDEPLRWQLRALRGECQPGHDLWPGIAHRIAEAPAAVPARRRARPGWRMVGAAASMLVAAGLAWHLPGAVPPTGAVEVLLEQEASALSRQYAGEISGVARVPLASAGVAYSPALRELDRNAARIRVALEQDPESRLLLAQLRRMYSLRLALAQRAAITS